MRLHPDFAGAQHLRETLSAAPFAADPARVEPVWRMLSDSAEASGWTLPERAATLDDPDLHILSGSRRIEPLSARDGRYVFAIRPGGAPLRLISRTARPSDARPWVDDRRQLGVLVRRLTVRTGQGVRDVAMDDPALGVGWHEAGWHALRQCRWTGGDALLPALGA